MSKWINKILKRKATSSPFAISQEDLDLEVIFTNFEHLRELFSNLVIGDNHTKRILIIHGVGGAGKSSLLKMNRLFCRRQGIPVALVPGDEARTQVEVFDRFTKELALCGIRLRHLERTMEAHYKVNKKIDMLVETGKIGVDVVANLSPVGGSAISAFGGAGMAIIADLVRNFLSKSEVDLYRDPTNQFVQAFLEDLIPIVKKQRIVLMLDTYEQMNGREEWIRNLVRDLPSNVVTIIAGRQPPGPIWDEKWPGWIRHAVIEELAPMAESDMRVLIERYYRTQASENPDPKQVDAIINFSQGLPLKVTTAVGQWVRYKYNFEEAKSKTTDELVQRLLKGTPREMQTALEAAASLRVFNRELLGILIPAEQVNAVYEELHTFSFVRSQGEYFALHDEIREMLNENLRMQDPANYLAFHKAAADYYKTKLGESSGDQRERAIMEILYHHFLIDEDEGTRMFCRLCENLSNTHIVYRLRAILSDAANYKIRHVSNKLWLDYYKARLAHLESRFSDADRILQTINNNIHSEPKLQAYALCDWGLILKILGQHERSITILERSLSIIPPDSKLALSYLELAYFLWRKGELKKCERMLDRAKEFFTHSDDRYGLAATLMRLRYYYIYLGYPKKVIYYTEQCKKVIGSIVPKPHALKAELLYSYAVPLSWFGSLSEMDRNLRDATILLSQLGQNENTDLIRDYAYILGMQGKYEKSADHFSHSIRLAKQNGLDNWLGITAGFKGAILKRQGRLSEAEDLLNQSLIQKQKTHDDVGLLEIYVWLGQLNETKAREVSNELKEASLKEAQSCYQRTINLQWSGRCYLECAALTGLIRVCSAQSQYVNIFPLLPKAEKLSQQYEYNDHLASVRLTQGHVAWDGDIPDWGSGFAAALGFYKQSLIYALRYNRFMLDEVLWGGGICTPLEPIIPHCLERGAEGRKMLSALRDWWKTGLNDSGVPRSDTISPIPEGIPLLEAERLARKREPGDGNTQQTVTMKLNTALT